jgi:hypothetical protein
MQKIDDELGNTEVLPEYYYNSRITKEWSEGDPQRALLENLRGDLVWKEPGPSVVEAVYAVARSIGDVELYDTDPSAGEVGWVLEGGRYFSSPAQFAHETAEYAPDSVGFFRSGELKVLGVDLPALDRQAKRLQALTQQGGESLVDNSDGYLLAFVHTGAHEVGHALLNGTGGTANSLGLGYGHLSATKRYLQNHPEEALTGNWETDVAAHEERFAEGYAVMVTTKVLSLLGYTAPS